MSELIYISRIFIYKAILIESNLFVDDILALMITPI